MWPSLQGAVVCVAASSVSSFGQREGITAALEEAATHMDRCSPQLIEPQFEVRDAFTSNPELWHLSEARPVDRSKLFRGVTMTIVVSVGGSGMCDTRSSSTQRCCHMKWLTELEELPNTTVRMLFFFATFIRNRMLATGGCVLGHYAAVPRIKSSPRHHCSWQPRISHSRIRSICLLSAHVRPELLQFCFLQPFSCNRYLFYNHFTSLNVFLQADTSDEVSKSSACSILADSRP